MLGWHHWLDGHGFEQAPGDGEGQGSLACCSLWGSKESATTEWLSNNKNCPTQINTQFFASFTLNTTFMYIIYMRTKLWYTCFLFLINSNIENSLSFIIIILSLPQSMWDLCSMTRYQTCAPCREEWSLKHWTNRGIPENYLQICNALPFFSQRLIIWHKPNLHILFWK